MLNAYSPAIFQTIKEHLKSSLTFKFTVVQQLDTGMKKGEAERMIGFSSVYNTVELMGAQIYRPKERKLQFDLRQTVILY